MVDLTKITLHDGIPVSGDGDVATINALMADGGLATVGNKADPASTFTDATPATLVAVMKQVSKSLQQLVSLLPDALGAGGGLKVDGSGFALPISGSVQSSLARGAVSKTSFTTGTSAYAAGDVLGVGASAAALQFASIASGAAIIKITSVALEIDRNAIISGETSYRLYLYNVTPPSALADSAAWDLPAGDRAAFLGFIDIPAVADLGATVYQEVNNINKMVKTLSANIFGYLVSIGPYTPTAVLHSVTIAAEQV